MNQRCGPPKNAAAAAQIEPVEGPALAEQVAQVAAPQVRQSEVAQKLNRGLGVAAVERRAVQVVLVEQADIPQEDQLAILEQDLDPPGSVGRLALRRR